MSHGIEPVAQQHRAGIPGLLRVELSGAHLAELHRSDDGLAVLGCGCQIATSSSADESS